MIRQRMDTDNKFVSRFNTKTGEYYRSSVLGLPKVDPFMSSMPELIDIGIMGHCKNNTTCLEAGIQCYQGGRACAQPHMKLEDYMSIIDQVYKDVYQVALGGHGDPNKHPNFCSIVDYTAKHNVVPNYTTSGQNLTEKEIYYTKKYCGAVAVSEHRTDYTREAIETFINEDITTNIHYVLGKNTIKEATTRLQNDDWDEGINAVIFLLHKPVGLGQPKNVLRLEDIKEFMKIIEKHDSTKYKIGFDSCTIPGIINTTDKINRQSIDTCEGARFSCYITPDMKMTPCSFDQDLKYAINLRTHSIQGAWNSVAFENFRTKLSDSCPMCEDQESCMGGCPLIREVVLCERGERDYN